MRTMAGSKQPREKHLRQVLKKIATAKISRTLNECRDHQHAVFCYYDEKEELSCTWRRAAGIALALFWLLYSKYMEKTGVMWPQSPGAHAEEVKLPTVSLYKMQAPLNFYLSQERKKIHFTCTLYNMHRQIFQKKHLICINHTSSSCMQLACICTCLWAFRLRTVAATGDSLFHT